MKYSYTGLDLTTNQQVNGELEAITDLDAVRELKQRNIEAIKVAIAEDKSHRVKKVKAADLVLPLQELATLVESGVVLLEAVQSIARKKDHSGVSKGFKKIASLIESGESFSSAIEESALPFPSYVSHLVTSGELTGELALALRSASEQMNYAQAIENDLKSALTYPLVLVSSGIIAMMIIFFAVVPKFTHMLDSAKELPSLAWFVLTAGKITNEHTAVVIFAVSILVIGLNILFTSQRIRLNLLNLAIDLPIIGDWLTEQDAARWASLTGAMLGARVGLVSALKLATESTVFVKRKNQAEKVISDVQSGVSLSDSLAQTNFLPASALNLIVVGDKTGQLANMLTAVAKLLDESCKRRMKRVLTLIEPLAILIVGTLIGIMMMGIVQAITASTDIAI